MILYVNGDSHAAGAEAVNNHAFAEDDPQYWMMGRAPHPDNKKVTWAMGLTHAIKSSLHLDAESASSNARIIRTTRDWLKQNFHHADKGLLMIIQWSTWERQEWLIEGKWFQVNASGIDDVPKSHQNQYKEYVRNVDWNTATQQAHQEIFEFHKELKDMGIVHVFFNGNTAFDAIPKEQQLDWGNVYIDPYNPNGTFDAVLKSNNFVTVSRKSYHYGAESHRFWKKYMLQYINDNSLLT
jgi:hypothetical protein